VKERLTKISLQAFRGVLDLYEIKLDQGQSLLMYGDNGTGKSSLADAIEWYFTGDIELLAKEGRDHAVRHLGAPQALKTLVEISTNGELGGSCAPKSPNEVAIEAASRETFLLRGRTIADFVDKSKGEKWSALQRLLGLGAIDELRTDLQKARSELKRTRDAATAKAKEAAAAVVAQKVKTENIDAALAKLAKACGFEAQDTIDDYAKLDLLSLIDPARSPSSRTTVAATLVAEIDATEIDIDTDAFGVWNETVDGDIGDPTHVDVLAAASRFVEAHPDTKQCPVCDKKVTGKALETKIAATLVELQEQSEQFSTSETGADNAADALTQLQKDRARWRSKAKEIGVELPAIADGAKPVKSAIADRRAIDVKKVSAFVDSLTAWDKDARTLLTSQSAEPEAPSTRNHAIEFGQLLVAAKQWSVAAASEQRATKAYDRADSVFELCQAEQKKYVQSVLEQISAEVARLFERLHPMGSNGRKVGSVAVETWGDKGIELAVDFYGQRQRPLHGVLSESYMNSVAIVLFLAMARTFNERLNFLVLDDVVNSFDVTHRGRLGDLLIEEFQDWQLVVLTHDRYFFDQVRRKVKGWSAYQVLGWSYDRGPSLREHRGATDVDAALELLDAGAIGDAARRGRRGLEHVLKELCEGLEAPLPYRRGNENEFREIGQLLNGLRRLLKDDSRGKTFLASIDGTIRSLEADAQSVLNAEAHASESGASAGEVRSTLERVRKFDALWTCEKCNTRIWKESGVRCRCGASPFPPNVAAK
jgi:energy-coupling factor transporter ATP-binding protein EcfA2